MQALAYITKSKLSKKVIYMLGRMSRLGRI